MKKKYGKWILWGLFILYMAALFRITVFRSTFLAHGMWNGKFNLIPFLTLFVLLQKNGIVYFLYLFLGNIIWFVPFGFFCGALFKKAGYWTVLWGFLLSFLIEFLQFFGSSGVSETDDLILNTLGAFLGIFLFCRIRQTTA